MLRYVALASAFDTESYAREILESREDMSPGTPYLGIWQLPTPERTRVHLFTSDASVGQVLPAQGWVRCLSV